MKKPTLSILLGSLLWGLLLPLISSCGNTQSGIDSRISQNPAAFSGLSHRDKERVHRGQVAEGMPRDAVHMAWGKPDKVERAGGRGVERERWLWFSRVPVYGPQFGYNSRGGVYTGVGFGFGGNGPGWNPSSTDMEYVRQDWRVVEFENGRVISWKESR